MKLPINALPDQAYVVFGVVTAVAVGVIGLSMAYSGFNAIKEREERLRQR
jgi:hypothetical protein